MSRGKNLQEMENAVTAGAKPAEPMQTMAGVSYEDLGGPTPENNKPDDDSNKLKDPAGEGSYAANLKSVKGVMAKSQKEAVETEEEVIAEDEIAEEEVVAEEEVTEEEVTEDEKGKDDFEEKLAGITYTAADEQNGTEKVEEKGSEASTNCPICGAVVDGGASTCTLCGYAFE